MPSNRSLTAALALALSIPFAGAHASDNCAEAVSSVKAVSKGSKITPVTDSKHTAKLSKARLEPGVPQTTTPSSDKKTAGLKAFQKHKGNCC